MAIPLGLRVAESDGGEASEVGGSRGVRTTSEASPDTAKAARSISEHNVPLLRWIERQENDRKLIAYELHDTFVQLAIGAKYNLEVCLRLREHEPAKADNMLQSSLHLLADAIDEARRVIAGLRPPLLDEAGLMPAIEDLLFENRNDLAPDVEFFHNIAFERLLPAVEVGVFRIIQEALRNARQHSRSETLRLELVERDDLLHIVVEDWGVGFDADALPANHFGLESMRERARLLGGTARIHSRPGEGTRVTVELPLVAARLPDLKKPPER